MDIKNAEATDPKEGSALIISDQQAAVKELGIIVTDGVAAIKEKYGAIKITKTDQKEAIALAKEGHSLVKDLASKVEKRRVELVAPALEFQRAVNDAAKGLIADLKEVQNNLKGQLDHVEDLKKIEKAEAAAAAAAVYRQKTQSLFDLGVQFNGNVYAIGSVIIHPDEIRDSDAEKFAVLLSKAEQEKIRVDEIAAAEAAELENTRRREAEIKKKEAELNTKARTIDLKALGAVLTGDKWRIGSVVATVDQVAHEGDDAWATILEALRLEKDREDERKNTDVLNARIKRLTDLGAQNNMGTVTFGDAYSYGPNELSPSRLDDAEFAQIVALAQREKDSSEAFAGRIQRLTSRGAKYDPATGIVTLGTVNYTKDVIKHANDTAFGLIFDAIEAERDRLIDEREIKRKGVLTEKGFEYSDITQCWVLGTITLNAQQVRMSNAEQWKAIGAGIDAEIKKIEASKKVVAEPTKPATSTAMPSIGAEEFAEHAKEAWRHGFKSCANSVIDAFANIKSRTEFAAFVDGLKDTPQPPDFL